MKKLFVIIFNLSLLLSVEGQSQSTQQDIKGSRDHPLLTRMPGFYISDYKDIEFESSKFVGADKKPVFIEGHRYNIIYRLITGTPEPGELKIRRNVQEALKKIGGKVVFDDNFNRFSTIIIQKDGKETWVEVNSYNNFYKLNIVEREMMKQDIVADAKSMGDDINNSGHIIVYGIFFDSGKSELKPESDSAIIQISKLLKNNASLKLYVVGHTDNVGNLEANMKLSNDRAIEVAKTLVLNYGIENDRLESYGVGSLAPVASNDTEEGRAKNRRVELVKQ